MAGRLVKTFEIFPNASLITTEEEQLKLSRLTIVYVGSYYK